LELGAETGCQSAGRVAAAVEVGVVAETGLAVEYQLVAVVLATAVAEVANQRATAEVVATVVEAEV